MPKRRSAAWWLSALLILAAACLLFALFIPLRSVAVKVDLPPPVKAP